jgi:mycothiol synthase
MLRTDAGAPIELDGAPEIPGLRFRHFAGPSDYPGMHAVKLAHDAAESETASSLEELQNYYEHLVNCDPNRHLTIVEADGRIVGYSRVYWNELNDGGRMYFSFGFIDPAWRRRGIGTALLPYNEALLREMAADHTGVERKWLESASADVNVGSAILLQRAGYEPVRYGYEMLRPTLDDIPDVPLPVGFEVRPVTRDQYRAIWEADAEAFRDHWGESEENEEAWERFRRDPDYADSSLWQVAWAGEEIAGSIINTIPHESNERFGRRRGYVDSVAVRRPWRRRGLARALLARSLRAMREVGLTAATLGVDTENPTGALQLYESLGFVPERRFTTYRKPLSG